MRSVVHSWFSGHAPRLSSQLAVGGAGLVLASIAAALGCLGQPALAQVESFMLKPGSKIGPATQVKPTNCVTAADGSVTCDTKIENSPSDTPAKPSFQPFKN